MSFADPVHLAPAGHIPGDFTARGEPEQQTPPADFDDDSDIPF
jgi:hypothetical protein